MKKSKNLVFYRKCIGQSILGRRINFIVNIWKQSAETESENDSWQDLVNHNKTFPFRIKHAKNVCPKDVQRMSKGQ